MAKSRTFDPNKPHPLVADYWVGDDDGEHSMVHTNSIAEISRACDAVRTIARIVHNSLSEPAMTTSQPLDDGTVRALLAGIDSLGNYIFEKTEDMRETAARFAEYERSKESQNG
ncbi:hypothetical protein QZN01_20945 [Burkholderia cenocepacia]|uniref:hypothetical protein n=1 Tax=Burkholderia cenocepacia TaxID=95486 RepID=UPI002653244D|nr:hypothetical protein [Burkholderia cenocepacia]MDN7825123.1 hypothetical protein [Burkholderia cenocepacia]